MKIAIFPGSFNPIHLGHIFIALDVYNCLDLDMVYFIPSNIPVHKQYLQDNVYHRYNMVKIAISEIPFFDICDFEIKNEDISYTYKTINYFKDKFKLEKEQLFLIIGEDWINNFDTWKNYKSIFFQIFMEAKELSKLLSN